ncbi:MAG: ethanolamine ammonia-lyase subunit EutB [Pseudomonadota bacterium]
MKLDTRVRNQHFAFPDLRAVMGCANEPKSGDALAGVGARSASERVAARQVLADLPLWEIREHPAVPYEQDEVTRLILDDLDQARFQRVRDWTVAQLREHVLAPSTTGADLLALGRGLTSEMIAACAKLMTNLDLMSAARKIRVVTHANSTLGLEGRLSVRLQPNHTTDDPHGILASTMEGLSFGSGDALIGVNPVIDSAESVRAVLELLHAFTRSWGVPTQHCCLAHVTTQMKALAAGSPMDVMFQSLAGSEVSCRAFGVNNAMLAEAAHMIQELGTARGPNLMYFETGQGSELSSGGHNGWDQVVLEARCYGLARHFKPFMVNTVVGFIGPEYLYDGKQVMRAGLEDHFMGKLHGLPMGIDVCYTNHMEADQNDLENMAVLMASAGANFFMGLPMGDDVMLNYQSTSFHDNAAVRELLGLRPTPEFERWLERLGLMQQGHLTGLAGDMGVFLR